MLDRQTFFNAVRADLFGGKLSENQVKGMEAGSHTTQISGAVR